MTEDLFVQIHGDPRWLPFLLELGKAPEQLVKIEFKVTLPQAEGSAATISPRPQRHRFASREIDDDSIADTR